MHGIDIVCSIVLKHKARSLGALRFRNRAAKVNGQREAREGWSMAHGRQSVRLTSVARGMWSETDPNRGSQSLFHFN